jgi:hypothetical protein
MSQSAAQVIDRYVSVLASLIFAARKYQAIPLTVKGWLDFRIAQDNVTNTGTIKPVPFGRPPN